MSGRGWKLEGGKVGGWRLEAGRRLRLEGRRWRQLGKVKVERERLLISNLDSSLQPQACSSGLVLQSFCHKLHIVSEPFGKNTHVVLRLFEAVTKAGFHKPISRRKPPAIPVISWRI